MRTRDRGRVLVLSGVLAALAAGAGRAEPLTIATYNVENYVAAGRRVEGVYRRAYPKPESAKAALRAVIRALDADVLALQEIGSAAYLEELRRDLRADGVDYPFAALGGGADAERHLALLSRRPFLRVESHDALSFGYRGGRETVKRGVLEAVLPPGGGDLTLFVVHLKSRYTDRKDDPASAERRAAEAEAVRDLVLAVFPNPATARFVIVGDCNDTPDSKPVRLLTRRGRTAVAFPVPAADPKGDTWTHAREVAGSYLRMDLILASPGLRPPSGRITGEVYDGPGVREASDHRPVRVTLESR